MNCLVCNMYSIFRNIMILWKSIGLNSRHLTNRCDSTTPWMLLFVHVTLCNYRNLWMKDLNESALDKLSANQKHDLHRELLFIICILHRLVNNNSTHNFSYKLFWVYHLSKEYQCISQCTNARPTFSKI